MDFRIDATQVYFSGGMTQEEIESRWLRNLCFDNMDERVYTALIPPNDCSELTILRFEQRRLKFILNKLEEERTGKTRYGPCLYCREDFVAGKAMYFAHLLNRHNFRIGAPENLVFTKSLVRILNALAEDLTCMYCEKKFYSMEVLKTHMRKKNHRRINPNNRSYDKFYVANYAPFTRSWLDLIKEEDATGLTYKFPPAPPNKGINDPDYHPDIEFEFNNYSAEGYQFKCLVCPCLSAHHEDCLKHMTNHHYLDFVRLRDEYQLNFYEQIQVVNYIRKWAETLTCHVCDEEFSCLTQMLNHYRDTKHTAVLPPRERWIDYRNLFPYATDDGLLCFLDTDEWKMDHMVIAEDMPRPSMTVEQFEALVGVDDDSDDWS